MHDVNRTASYEIIHDRLSVGPALNFLKTGSLVFSDIVHGDSWPWFLVIGEAKFFGEKTWRPEFWPDRNEVFLEFES